MTTIALVDDDRSILTSVSMSLEAEGYSTVTYTNGASALEALQENEPDAAIIDIKLPRMDGMELLRRMRLTSQVPIIVLSSKDQEMDQLLGFKMGADDYLTKPVSHRVLLERLAAVLRRVRLGVVCAVNDNAAGIVRYGSLYLDPDRHACRWNDQEVALTVTEFKILQVLAQRPGVVKSRDAIIDAAYGDMSYVSDRTIDGHIKRLRTKLEMIDSTFDSIETLYGVGYRFKED